MPWKNHPMVILGRMIRPYYFANKRGRKPIGIETMLRMYLMQIGLICPMKESRILSTTVTPCVHLCI